MKLLSQIFLRHVSYLYPWPDGRLGSKIESWSVIRFSNWEYKNERRHLLLTISAWQSGKEKKITLCVNIALKLDFSSHLDNAPNYIPSWVRYAKENKKIRVLLLLESWGSSRWARAEGCVEIICSITVMAQIMRLITFQKMAQVSIVRKFR